MIDARCVGGAWVAMACVGCSVVAVRGESTSRQPLDPPRCTSHSIAPALDTTGAVLFGAGALSGILAGASSHCPPSNEFSGCAFGAGLALAAGVAAIPFSVGYALSAVYGHSTVRRCREEMADREALDLLRLTLHPPWVPLPGGTRLTLLEARELCSARGLRLPARSDALALAAERGEHRFPVRIWTRDVEVEGDLPAAPPGNRTLQAESLRAFSVDLATGNVARDDVGDRHDALCVR